MLITVVTVGSKPKPETAALIDSFVRRLPSHIRVKWRFIPNATSPRSVSKQQETESILRSLPTKGKIVLLDETGEQLSSPELAKQIFNKGGDVTFIIGGAYGVTDILINKADIILSLGKLVYPHQLVRIILAEQIYRAYSIHIGHPYHHS